MSQRLWEDDSIQFPRLIAEIMATQEIDAASLCESMDITLKELVELCERADKAWKKIKCRIA